MSSFFFNDPATTQIYTLSLHDALPISRARGAPRHGAKPGGATGQGRRVDRPAVRSRRSGRHAAGGRSEEHTSELQSHSDLVCRLLLEKKKKKKKRRGEMTAGAEGGE